MGADECVLMINPDPTKQGVRIEKAKYHAIREAILESLFEYGPMTSVRLGFLVEDQLGNEYDSFLYTAVKLDMEVQGELHRMLKSRPRMVGFGSLPCAM